MGQRGDDCVGALQPHCAGALTRPTRTVRFAVAALVALGAWLRLSGLQWMEFKTDEQLALALAIDLLTQHPWSSDAPWPAHGMQSSGGIANAPLFTWIVAAFWSMTRHPVGVAACIGAVNALALIPLWYFMRRHMDEPRALLALALLAVSPFAVLFSRKIWTQDLLLPGLVAVFWGIEWLRVGHRWRGLPWLLLGILTVGQLHQSGAIALVLLPVAAVLHVLAHPHQRTAIRRRLPTRLELTVLIAAVAVNLFFWWPYISYLSTLNWRAWPGRELASSLAPGLLMSLVSQVIPWDLVAFFRSNRDAFLFDPTRDLVFRASVWLAMPLCVYGVWRWFRAPRSLQVIGLWWWLVVIAFALARVPERHFYVLVLAPLPALLAAGAFDAPSLSARISALLLWWRWTYAASLLALTILTTAWIAGRGGATGDYGVTFAIRRDQARALQSRLRVPPLASGPMTDEVGAAELATFECHRIPGQVVWLLGWLDGGTLAAVNDFQLCDRWVGVGGDEAVYRWTLRDLR